MNISLDIVGIFSINGAIIKSDELVLISKLPDILSILDIILITMTAIIAPEEAIATNPKLSFSEDLLSFLRVETPIARANINGTVRAPVVAPDASKDIAKNSGDVNKARIKINPYNTDNILYKGILYTILASPKASMIAIPIDTITNISPFPISPDVTISTCAAKICKSGSAIDMTNPKTNPAIITINILFDFAIFDPIILPIGVIPISTPTKNIESPIIIARDPIRNLIIKGVSRGVNVKFNISTITVIGITEYKTSLSFETIKFK